MTIFKYLATLLGKWPISDAAAQEQLLTVINQAGYIVWQKDLANKLVGTTIRNNGKRLVTIPGIFDTVVAVQHKNQPTGLFGQLAYYSNKNELLRSTHAFTDLGVRGLATTDFDRSVHLTVEFGEPVKEAVDVHLVGRTLKAERATVTLNFNVDERTKTTPVEFVDDFRVYKTLRTATDLTVRCGQTTLVVVPNIEFTVSHRLLQIGALCDGCTCDETAVDSCWSILARPRYQSIGIDDEMLAPNDNIMAIFYMAKQILSAASVSSDGNVESLTVLNELFKGEIKRSDNVGQGGNKTFMSWAPIVSTTDVMRSGVVPKIDCNPLKTCD